MFRVDVVGVGGLNKTGGRKEERKRGKERFVQDRCGWQREPEQNGKKERRRKERDGKICAG